MQTSEKPILPLLLSSKTHSFASIIMKKLFKQHFEVLIWISALISLAVINPLIQQVFSLCLLHTLGFEHCPGCGLGRSVSFLLHGNIFESFASHWFGIPALFIILHRIATLLKQFRNQSHHHSAPH
jgi:hypothetical protein